MKKLFFAFQSAHHVTPDAQQLESFKRKYLVDYNTRETYEGQELLQQYRMRAWKHPRYSQLISFIVGIEHEGKLFVSYITGTEQDIITKFCNILQKYPDHLLYTFNSQIVLPYLGIRFRKNGLFKFPHKALNYLDKRPWDLLVKDVQNIYDGAGNYKSSIKDIAEDLGLPSDHLVPTEDEFEYYFTDRLQELKMSAIQEIEVMFNAVRILEGQEPLQTILKEDYVKDEEPVDLGILEQISGVGRFDLTIKEQIAKLNIQKEDVDVVAKIILSHYLVKTDKADVKKQKTEEVLEYLNTLCS